MGQYKYKVKDIPAGLKEAPEDNLPKVDKKGKFKVGDSKSEDGVKSTIVDIDKETGGIKWDIEYLPNFDKLFDGATDLVNISKGVYTKAKSDNKLRLIYDEARVLRNKIRTHIRNEYPEEYRRITMKMNEGDLDEMSTTGGGGNAASFTGGTGMQYATPYAFKKKNKKKVEELNIGSVAGTMAALRKDKNKPSTRVMWDDMSSEEKENLLLTVIKDPDDPRIDQFIDTKYNLMPLSILRDMGIDENIGANLGPGPKATEDGVKDNAYVKQFAYKLVPKKIKGSGMIVKQLFEEDKEEKKNFQLKRIEAFDGVEKKLNNIYTMISNAKNETIKYYKDNPDSFKVVKPTDLIEDYLEDIKKLLKKE